MTDTSAPRIGSGEVEGDFWYGRASGTLVLIAAALSVYAVRRTDADLWGYLAYGRLFLEQGARVTSDPFAYTSGGLQWVTFEHLAQMSLWVAYSWLGPAGLVALKCVTGGLAIYFLYVAIRTTTDDAAVWVPVFLLCTSTVARYFLFRPQLFTFAFMAVFVAIVTRFLLRGHAALWILPPVMWIWANMHGGFLAGIGVLGLAILLRAWKNLNADGIGTVRTIGTGTRPLWLALAVSVLLTLLTPNGPRLWTYVVTEVLHNTNRRFIAEWSPPSFGNDPWSLIAITILTGSLAIVGGLTHRHVARVAGLKPWQWLLSCAPLAVMAYLSVRHVPIAAIWIGPVLTILASSVKHQAGSRPLFRGVWVIVTASAVASILLMAVAVSVQPLPAINVRASDLGSRNPCRAVAFLRRNQLRGNVYNPLWWGAYVTWELYPAIRVSMDGRNISLFSREMVLENLTFYEGGPDADADVPLRYATDFLLIPTDSPILSRILMDRRWQMISSDSDAVLLSRADLGHEVVQKAFESGSLAPAPEPCPQFLQ